MQGMCQKKKVGDFTIRRLVYPLGLKGLPIEAFEGKNLPSRRPERKDSSNMTGRRDYDDPARQVVGMKDR